MVAVTALAWLLLDILLLFFVGIVVAAAFQPWQVTLCAWGVPKGLAVLLIYLLLLLVLFLVGLIVAPVLVEQIGTFVAGVPTSWASARGWLRSSSFTPLQFLGERIPSFASLEPALTSVAPHLYKGTLGVTTGIVMLPGYFVTVLAIGFYWTMELPVLERLLLSLLPVEQRPRALNVWHEIESKLGGFLRGQGLAMLVIGVASAIGYALIGLPNVLALGVLAGLLEAVPWIGPLLAVVPALLVAVPLGTNSALLVMGFAVVLQVFENNILIPRIMRRSAGVSALVSVLAILALGTLYGILGVLIAIPIAIVVQVLLETLVIDAEPIALPSDQAHGPWDDLRVRLQALRQHARVRLRRRTSRMGIDPKSNDHVVDAEDQEIEVAVARIERSIAEAERTPQPVAHEAPAATVEDVDATTSGLEKDVERANPLFRA
ncbi:MAG: AI-2E family transporter [Candidatus Binatia bacterium]